MVDTNQLRDIARRLLDGDPVTEEERQVIIDHVESLKIEEQEEEDKKLVYVHINGRRIRC